MLPDSVRGVPHRLLIGKNTLIDLLVQSELYRPKPQPQRRRRIARTSDKLAFVGLSYHEKTQSSAFFLDYLRQYFDVEVILDGEWSGIPLPDLSFLDDRYFGVIFFQTQPTPKRLAKIRNDNVIFVPMYDSVAELGYTFWRQFKSLKIINFSSTLYQRLLKWGLNTMYIQYFPMPSGFAGGNVNDIFFWQRVARINVPVLASLFDGRDVRVHVHRGTDPLQNPVAPSWEDEARLELTYSDWFESREEMLDVVRQKGIFVAPREREGIGMSFLEAMAMGKAVVAADSPTMNEYIEHAKTGYLFDLNRPEPIDLADVRGVQRNAYQRVCEGHEEWESGKHRIIEFIRAD